MTGAGLRPTRFTAHSSVVRYGGSAIVASGDTIRGNEGNGTVAFFGTFGSISFTTPHPETAGAVPEPSTWAMVGLGFAAFRQSTKARAAIA